MNREIKKENNKWEWFGHAGHFIACNSCRFHLCTKVGKYLVSTVGDYYIMNYSNNREERTPLSTFDGDDFFETMVFRASKRRCTSKECGCGLPLTRGMDLERVRYSTAKEAKRGHLKLCEEYSNLLNQSK